VRYLCRSGCCILSLRTARARCPATPPGALRHSCRVAALAAVLRAPPEGVDPYVLVAIRADSVQSLLVRVAELGLEAPKPLYLPPLSTAAYREVVLRPAEVYSERVRALAVEPDLVQALVEDATGADALPLLAFTLGQLFNDFRAEGKLTLAQYRAGEGVGGSIRRALKDAQLQAGAAGSEDNLRRLIVHAARHLGPGGRPARGRGQAAGREFERPAHR
jgi:hypothetical protein